MSKVNRSHPPSIRKTVRKTLLNECKIPEHSHILVAVSGGSDSMALLVAMNSLKAELGFNITCCSINHNLRPEAKSEVQMVFDFCLKNNINFIRRDVFLSEGSNVQSRARDARYEALRQAMIMVEANFIATAHHAEDHAETVLMRILRGTSVKGLCVLEPQDNDILRPMIRARKADVMLYIKHKDIPYVDDPSNKYTEKYLRSHVRYNILPELQKINPNIVEALCELSASAKYPEVTGHRVHRKKQYKDSE